MSSREEQRQKIKNKYQQLNAEDLIYIPAKKQLPVTEDTPKKRTCAYCRVSTDDPAQTTSYELQKEHYEEEINKNPNWIFVGIYADEGISATSMKHRDNFNRMIAAAEAGKIDVIVTKAVSRFARNVVDCLSTVRHLSALNPPVGVIFETEGINTLDSTSEMILAVMAAAAQEESKTKSNSMNWSLENRFKKGKFLTPVLLGYDHDDEGNLIVNQEEALTVKLIYYMYLSGFPVREIAEILTQLKRETKLGNMKWSAKGVKEIMRNERYCGNVLSWKTFTYDFWEHKKRKNNQDKPQVLKVDHHEAIVSHEVFDAAIMKLEAEKNIKNGIPLPALEVVDSGALKGYVSVNRLWSGFSGADYTEASQSAYEDGVLNQEEVEGFSLNGYQIVSENYFSTNYKPAMTVAKGMVKFNSNCLKKFRNVEYVELLVNSVEKCIAVRPCSKENPNAIKWGRLQGSKWVVSPKSCSGFAGPLYEIMDWEADCGYRLCGQYIESGDEQMLLFDLSDPQVTRYEILEGADIVDDESNVTNKVLVRKIKVVKEGWGRPVGAIDCFYFKEKQYCGNWSILQPTRIYKICGNVSQETITQINNDAYELLEQLMTKMA